MSRQTHLEIDLHDSLQPIALLRVNQTLRRMQSGERLKIRGADPSTYQALMRLLPEERFTITEADFQPAGYLIRLTCRLTDNSGSDPGEDPPSAPTKGEQHDNQSEQPSN